MMGLMGVPSRWTDGEG